MQFVDNQTWLEVTDWEQSGYKMHTVVNNISKSRKSWSSITTTGKGRETLYLYESLSAKHQTLFCEMVKKFLQVQEAKTAIKTQKNLSAYILECVQTDTKDIVFFEKQGFTAERLHKATIYARRAAWLKFLSGTTSAQIKRDFAPCTTKIAFFEACLPVMHAENCFNFQKPNVQYLQKLLARYNKQGLLMCADARNDKQNALKLTTTTEDLLLSIMKSILKPTAMQVWEAYDAFLEGRSEISDPTSGEVFQAKDYKTLSYSSIQKIVANPLNTAAYAGIHGSNLTYRSKHGRFLERERPAFFGTMITCDDWDLPVDMVPFEWKDAKGKVKTYNKIKLYLFFDVCTRHCVGYAYSAEKNTPLFLAGLINMLQNPVFEGNMPYELQSESHLLKQLQNGILKEGELFQKISILPKNPMGKYAESDIRNLKYGVLHKDARFADYFKGRYYARSEAWRQEKDDQGKTKKLKIEEVPAFLAAMIATWNEAHPQNADFHTSMLKQNPERIAYHLSKPVKTTYHNGIFRYKNQNYEFSDIDSVLAKLKNKDLVIKNSLNLTSNEVFVYHEEQFLASASPVRKVQASVLERTEADKQAQSAFYANQTNLDKKVVAQIAKAKKVTITEKDKKPLLLTPTAALASVFTNTFEIPGILPVIPPVDFEDTEEKDHYDKIADRMDERRLKQA